jgi:hypothetical protein
MPRQNADRGCVYVRGEVNQAADALSRLALGHKGVSVEEDAQLEVVGQEEVSVGAVVAQWATSPAAVGLVPLEEMVEWAVPAEDEEEEEEEDNVVTVAAGVAAVQATASAVGAPDSELALLLERGSAAVRTDETVADLVRAADERREVDGLEPRWEAGHLVVRAVADEAEPPVHRRVRVVVPLAGRDELLRTLHARGLFSASKLGELIAERFYWPGMARDVQALIDGCDECIKAAHVNRTSNNFGDSEAGSGADERVFAAREGYQADTWQVPELGVRVVALVCLFTGFTLLMPVEDGSAAESARVVESAFSVLGVPRFVKTDGGPEFGGAFGERLRALGVRLVRGTPYNSDGQARAERRIGEANYILRRLIMHARPAGAPDVAALLMAAQTAINAVVLPKVVRERVGGAMTRSGAFFGSEPRFEVLEWATAADEEDAPIGVGAPGTLPGDGHSQVARVRLALAAAYEAGSRNGDFVPVALSAAQRETQRERAVEASYRARAAAYDPTIRPVVGDLVWRRQVAPGERHPLSWNQRSKMIPSLRDNSYIFFFFFFSFLFVFVT